MPYRPDYRYYVCRQYVRNSSILGLFRGRLWLSVSTHRTSVAVRGRPVDGLGDFGPRGLSVQYTEDVCRFPPAHTGRPWLSVAVRCPWLSISTYSSTLVLGLSTLALPVDCLGDFGPRGLSVQYTQDVSGYPPAHTGRLWLSVAVRQDTQDVCGYPCVFVCVLQHTQDFRGCPSVHISARWSLDSARWPFPWTVWVILAHVGCLFSTHRTSVSVRQHTHDVCGCPWLSVSTHRTSVAIRASPCVSVCVRQHTQDVRGCPSVHISARWSLDSACWPFPWTVRVILAHTGCLFSTHKTSVGVRQNTLDVCVCPSAHAGRLWLSVCVCVGPSAHTGRPWLSISTHISTLVLGLSTLTLPVVCSGDFGPCGLSVQYTQDICGCPPAHTGQPLLSLCVRQQTQDVRGLHTGRPCVSVSTQGRPCVSVSTHKTSVAVLQHTQDIRSCPSAHTAHPWLSISTHIRTFVLGLSMLALPVDCLGYFSRRGLSVQYTQDFRGCPPAHTGRLWLSVSTHRMSVAIRVCPCVSISTNRMSVAVNQYTYQHAGPWTQHAGPSRGLFGTHMTSVAVRVSPCESVCVCVCPSAHTGRPWLSVCVRLCPSAHTGRPTSVCVRQHTQDVRVCSSAHTGRLWLSVSTHRASVAVRVCPCVSVSTHRTFVAVRYTYQHAGPWSQHAGPSRGLFGTSVAVRQHTGCLWLSVCVHVCPSAHTGLPWLSISTHISTLVLGLSTLALPVDCLGDFGPRGLSVQYTQDVHGCPPAHTGRLWLFVAVHQNTQDISGCPCVSVCVRQHTQDARVCPSAHTGYPCVSVSTHRMSVAVHPYTYQHAGPWTQHAGPSRGLFG
ncbi:hypothetical protein YC2023_066088 [Brassica napus]